MRGQIPKHLTKEMDNLNTQTEHGRGWTECKHYEKKSRNYDLIRTLDHAKVKIENILVLLT
jgi:hypothetical protein